MSDAGRIASSPADNATAAFRVRRLTKIYRTGEVEVHALRGVVIDLYEGEMAALLGPSGSGKSTFLNIIGRLVLEALEAVNRELGTTTALITHNAGMAEMAHRIIRFADGAAVEVRVNETRRLARELEW